MCRRMNSKVRVDAEYLLNDDDATARITLWIGAISAQRVAIAGSEFYLGAHESTEIPGTGVQASE